MTARLFPALLALLLLAAPASFASDNPLDDGSSLDRMGDTGGILGGRATQPLAPAPAASRVCNGVETGNNLPCLPPTAPPVPVDGGLTLLALAGAGYATRKLRARRA